MVIWKELDRPYTKLNRQLRNLAQYSLRSSVPSDFDVGHDQGGVGYHCKGGEKSIDIQK